MKYNMYKKFSMAALAASMVAAPAINVFAAPEDIIDTTKTANLTIHKYDMTAAKEDGVVLEQFKANGKKDAAAEAALQKYTIDGVEFSYQKVGDICTESDNGKIQVMYVIPTALQQILGLTTQRTDNKFTSDEINSALSTVLKENTKTKDALEKYMRGAGGMSSVMTEQGGVATATNLPLGLYLIVETKVPANVHTTVDPFFVSLPMTDHEGEAWFYDVDVYPKNQTNIPDLDKTVRQNDDAVLYGKPEYTDTATASEGDKIDYLIVSHLPKITSSATYLTQYKFTDILGKGLKYGNDAKMCFYDNATDAKANNTANAVFTWDTGSPNFKASSQGAYEKAKTMVFDVTKEGLAAMNKQKEGAEHSEYSDLWMAISYTAVLASDETPILGDTGNTNHVTLEWRRTNMDIADDLEDKARVFSYGIELKKFFKSDDPQKKGDPTKVNFSLFNETDRHYVTATQIDPGSGVYYVTDNLKGNSEEKGTVFVPSVDGTLIIKGLEANDYVMTELRTDKGFTLLKEPIKISIKQTQDKFTPSKTTLYDTEDIANNPNKQCIEVNGERAYAVVDNKKNEDGSDMKAEMKAHEYNTLGDPTPNANSTNAFVKLSVTNTPGFALPATGGAGTIAFTVAGCSVAFAGIAMLTKKSKKHEDEK